MPSSVPVLALTAALAIVLPPIAGEAKPSAARVLFVGNSLTYENNLPAMIEAVAAQAGFRGRVTCRGVAKPNYGLAEHWNDGEALRGIQDGHWTHVVLQQGPSSLPESQAILRDYARRFALAARRRRAAVMLYAVWPPKTRSASFDAVTASYTRAAEETGATLVAVGEAWRSAWRRDPALPLYAADDFHPSPAGTYLAALMFVHRLTGVSPIGLPGPETSSDRALGQVRLDPRQLSIVQEAAAQWGPR